MEYLPASNTYGLDDTDRECLGTSALELPMAHWEFIEQRIVVIREQSSLMALSPAPEERQRHFMKLVWAATAAKELAEHVTGDVGEVERYLAELAD